MNDWQQNHRAADAPWRRLRSGALVASLLFIAACSSSVAPNETPAVVSSVATSAASWQKIVPGGDTLCSDGSEFAFHTRMGDPTRLLFFLQGGGACWNLQTCDPLGQPSYTVNLARTDPAQSDGVFNLSRADNPLRDHTMVFVPYCSADVHIGRASRTYERPAAWVDRLVAEKGLDRGAIPAAFTVEHRGFANVQAAFDWVADNLPAPASVLVTGSSAGSIPSPYYALEMARRYPQARVTQLGDGSGGYRRISQSASPHTAWDSVAVLRGVPGFGSLTNDNFNFEQLYVLAKRAAPAVRMHAFDTAEDDVQLQFLRLGGLDVESLLPALLANQADIRRADPAFQSFIAAGELHTILRRPEFYATRAGDVSVRDWVAALARGERVGSPRCGDCAAP